MRPFNPLTAALLLVWCALPCCQSFTVVPRLKMLFFKPEPLVLSEGQPQGTLSISCSHPTRDNIKKFYDLKIERRKIGAATYECLVDSSNACGDSYACARLADPCAPAPVLAEKEMSVSGTYNNTLVLTITNATCHDARDQFRCYSVLIKNAYPYPYMYSEQERSFSVEAQTPRPEMTIHLDAKDEASHANTPAVGDQLRLECRAVIGLTTDTVTSEWMWDKSDGGGRVPIDSKRVSTKNDGCLVLATSSLTTEITTGKLCYWLFRCYVAQGTRKFDVTAAKHKVSILQCGTVAVTAISVAILGTVVLMLGVAAMPIAVVLRRKMNRKLRKRQESEPSEASERSEFANPNDFAAEERVPKSIWPASVHDFAQNRWPHDPLLQLPETSVDSGMTV